MSKNHERALVCNRVKDAGYPSARTVAKQAGCTLTEAADVLLKIKASAVEYFCYGQAAFTGKTKTLGGNGTIAFEIRCRHCKLTYWETGLPYALCVDCRCMVVRKLPGEPQP